MEAGELFIKIGAVTDLTSVRNSIATITGAFAGVQYGLSKFFDTAISKASGMQNFEMQTGLMADKLQILSQVAQSVNLDIGEEDVARSISNIQKMLTDIKLGGGDLTGFRMLNLNPFGNAFDILDQVRDRIKGLDDATATNLIQRIGIDPKMLSVLRLSNEEFAKLGKNFFLSKEQRESVLEFGKSIKQLTLGFKGLKDQAIAQLAPELTKLVKNVFQWLNDNSDKIVAGISAITLTFVDFSKAVTNAFNLIASGLDMISSGGGIEILSKGLVLLALSFSPVILGLTLFIGLLDDIKVWMNGGESLFGGLYQAISKIPNLEFVFGGAAALVFLQKLGSLLNTVAAALMTTATATKLLKGVGFFLILEGLAALYNNKDEIKEYFDKQFPTIRSEEANAGSVNNIVTNGGGNYSNTTNSKNDSSNKTITNNITMTIQSNANNNKEVADYITNQFTDLQMGFLR